MTHVKRSLTVLVVDDEALLRWSLAEILRRSRHSVIEAQSAENARDAITGASTPIDVVLLDYRLPDSNDLRLLEDVRRRLPRSAVVLMTAFGTPDVMQGALDRGAYCVLSKPFDLHGVAGARHRGTPGLQTSLGPAACRIMRRQPHPCGVRKLPPWSRRRRMPWVLACPSMPVRGR